MLYKNLFGWLLISSMPFSCVLHNASTELTPYQQAMLYYESKNYCGVLQVFEEVMPMLLGNEEETSAYFSQAYCSFYTKQYLQSSERFEHFYKSFPRDHRVLEAMYMQGHALYLGSPDVKLDQTLTQAAAQALRNYLNCYPKGVYLHEASTQLGKLGEKLALKDLNTAKLYHRLMHYRAAVVTLENYQKDFPNSSYNEEVAYLKADAQYQYFRKVEEKYKLAKHSCSIAKTSTKPQSSNIRSSAADQERIDAAEAKEGKTVASNKNTEIIRRKNEKEQQLSLAIKY